MNKVILIGRLVKQPELNTLPTGNQVVQCAIAVQRKFKNQNGEYEADFINFVAFGTTAQLISNYFTKGDRIGLEGRWQRRSYQNKEGVTVYVDEMVVDNIEFLQERREQPAQQQYNQYNQAAPEPKNPFAGESFDIDDSDLPF